MIWHVIGIDQGESSLDQSQDLFFQSIQQADTELVQFVAGVREGWSHPGWLSEPILRDSTALGDTRGKPYLKDLFDMVSEMAGPDDWLFYSSGDCSVRPDLYRELAELRATVVEYQRLDVEGDPADLEELFQNPNAPYLAGLDGLALRKSFYQEFRDCLPDFIIGEPWWDQAYSWILRELVPVRRLTGRLFRRKHDKPWNVADPGPAGAYNYELMKRALDSGQVQELTLYSPEERADTAVITCLFGDCPLRLKASLKGLEEQLKQDLFADHYLIELLEPGQESRLPEALLERFCYLSVIGGENNRDLFQKEAMFNLAWKRASALGDYACYLFTDADIYAEDRSWFRQIRDKLKEDPRRAVHGYRVVRDSVDPEFSFASLGSAWALDFQTDLPMNPGLCWGFHRKMLEMGEGFNPYCLECAGDSALVTEYLNHPGAEYDTSLWDWPWYRDIHRVLRQRAVLDAVPVDLVHVHHGPAADRHYNEVRRALSKLRPIPELVRVDEQRLLAWRDASCPERSVLKSRSEFTSHEKADEILQRFGVLNDFRDLPTLELPERQVPDWPSERSLLWRDREVASKKEEAMASRYLVFQPSQVFREAFPASWCDNVERSANHHIPMRQDKEQPRLLLQGLEGRDYIIGLTALQPNWGPIDVRPWGSLHLSVLAQGPAGDVVIQLVSQDGQGVEHESEEIKLFERGLKVGQEQDFILPLREFLGPPDFDLARVRTVKFLGSGSFCLEVFCVYFQ